MIKYILILLFFCQCSAQETKIQDGEWVQLTISKKDTIIFNPCHSENRRIIIRNDSLIDFTGQEKIACKIRLQFDKKEWKYIVLEENCSYSDTISFKLHNNNIIQWKMYNDIDFYATSKEYIKRYKIVNENCEGENVTTAININKNILFSSFLQQRITAKNIVSSQSKNIIESTISKYTTMDDYGSDEFYNRESKNFHDDKISSEDFIVWNLCLSKLDFENIADHDELESDWRYPFNKLSFAQKIMEFYKDTSYGDAWQHIASTPKYQIALYMYYLPWKDRKNAYDEIDKLKLQMKNGNN